MGWRQPDRGWSGGGGAAGGMGLNSRRQGPLGDPGASLQLPPQRCAGPGARVCVCVCVCV